MSAVDLLSADALATGAVLFAVTCQVIWPFCGRRSLIILLQFCTNGGFTAHYGLLGFWSASAVSALAATQAMSALFAGHRDPARRLGYLLIPAMVIAGATLWNGPITLLAVGAMVVIAVGRMQMSDRPLRLLLMAGAAIWAAHDLIIASYLALLGDLLTIAFGTWQMLRSPASI